MHKVQNVMAILIEIDIMADKNLKRYVANFVCPCVLLPRPSHNFAVTIMNCISDNYCGYTCTDVLREKIAITQCKM